MLEFHQSERFCFLQLSRLMATVYCFPKLVKQEASEPVQIVGRRRRKSQERLEQKDIFGCCANSGGSHPLHYYLQAQYSNAVQSLSQERRLGLILRLHQPNNANHQNSAPKFTFARENALNSSRIRSCYCVTRSFCFFVVAH